MTEKAQAIKTDIEQIVGPQWTPHLVEEFASDYMDKLKDKIVAAATFGTVYPHRTDIFKAYQKTGIDDAKVLILGQDPYHDGVATGLAFDVGDSNKINPSLRNIQKEIKGSVGPLVRDDGNLEHWADQGVLLLNTVLTVDKGAAHSHKGWGWERFIAATLTALANRDSDKPLVVILWGKAAQGFASYFSRPQHLVLTAPHPAAEGYAGGRAGFFGCGHFRKCNNYLKQKGETPIQW